MEPIKTIVKDLLHAIEKKQGAESVDKLTLAWETEVDSETRLHARILDVKRECLRLVVDSSAWMYEINLRKKDLIKIFQKQDLKINDIKLYIGKVK